MLKQRIITALILLPIALGGFFWLDGAAFALFIAGVVSLGAWEWARLAGVSAQVGRVGYAALVAGLILVLFALRDSAPWVAGAVLLLAVLWWLLAVFLVLGYPATSRFWGDAVVKLGIGLLILLPAWQGLVLLKEWPLANWLIVAVMVLVWAADVGAYFSGKAFGRRKLAPQVSPGKSWEGLIGGLLLSLFIVVAVGLYRDWVLGDFLYGLLGAAAVVLISVVGDLTESMFKRQSGIKDSSNLLPGHGGVLDRIDSLTAAIPVFTVLLWSAGWGSL
ncbi:phosphatidate cytidylyltransferase [Pseudomonas sp. UL073]|uniref:Phosphatidate cytidylyltransferase n=1 Tax=Zestomonas insulae TaxID=2809017 RepID=A0ABS2IA12_9GAMM|nr:phosphatidate cytidylyltransferase [Pseudomonas insulae]MBM7059845.1 phosphatidate cytidylyltransferase [Pseudomonas insulae]